MTFFPPHISRLDIPTAILLILCFVFAGCAGKVPSQVYPGVISDEEILEGVLVCQNLHSDFSAKAKIVYDGPQGRRVVRGWVGVRMPDSIRVELDDPFGRPMVIVVVHQGTLKVLDLTAATLSQMSATPGNIFRYLKMEVDANTAARLLSGLPLHGMETKLDKNSSGEDLMQILTVPQSGEEGWRIFVDRKTGAIVQVAGEASGNREWKMEYSDPLVQGGCTFAKKNNVHILSRGLEMGIIYSDTVWDSLSDIVFDLPIPEGVTLIEVP